MWPSIALLTFVTLQRLVELPIAGRNTRRLIATGAHEVSPGHYPFIVALHVAWLGTLWIMAVGRAIDPLFLLLFAIVEIGRLWVLTTLGPRWTTRIIVVPRAALEQRGPYRLVQHPNYWVVTAEIAILPMVFDLKLVAFIFSILNAIILTVRIRAENRALGR